MALCGLWLGLALGPLAAPAGAASHESIRAAGEAGFLSLGTSATRFKPRLASAAQGPSPAPSARNYVVDPARSVVRFTTGKFFVQVQGTVEAYAVQAHLDPMDPSRSTISVTLDMESVRTPGWVPQSALKSALKTAEHRFSTLTIDTIVPREPPAYEFEGELEFRGETTREKLAAEITVIGNELRVKGSFTRPVDGWKTTVRFDLRVVPNPAGG